MDELEACLQRHPRYKDVSVYHKFHTMKERQQAGVILRGASGTRVKLSADDHMGQLVSFCNVSNIAGTPGVSLDWVWEDQLHLTLHYVDNDVTSLVQGDRLTVRFPTGTVLTAGFSNLTPATNFAQVSAKVDGVPVVVGAVDGKNGVVYMNTAVPPGSTLTLTYDVLNIAPPGYYLLEMLTDDSFQVTPMYTVEEEVVIHVTTGTELTASLSAGAVNLQAPLYLYTRKNPQAHKILLDLGIEYTIGPAGDITFLEPLRADTTLYATYRWQGPTSGPFAIEGENTSNNKAIKGVILAFGEKIVAGDKHVIQVCRDRSPMASVSGGHYDMQFDILVYTRDPESLSEIVDHLISDTWGGRRHALMSEGYTIKDMDPSGEAEENYDDQAGIMYFQHSISLSMMTEWKKFYPYVVSVRKVNLALHQYPAVKGLAITDNATLREYNMVPKEFEVTYPRVGFPRL